MDGTFALTGRARRGPRSSARRSQVSGGNPSVARCGDAQLASAEIERLQGHVDRLRERRRAALEVDRIADREQPLGRERGEVARGEPAHARQMQGVGLKLIQAKASQRDEQVIAAHPPEAGQREPLEQPLEAPLAGSTRGRRRTLPAGSSPSCGRRASVSVPRAGSWEVRGPSGTPSRSGSSPPRGPGGCPANGSSPSSGHR